MEEKNKKESKIQRWCIPVVMALEAGIGYLVGIGVGPESIEMRDVNGDNIQDVVVRAKTPLERTEYYFYGISQGDSISGQSISYLSENQIKEMYEGKVEEKYSKIGKSD
ncbi:hypothetical protein HYT57_02180 [Candidatus Woesearchaeota archaeon]|nr:hypothetical protein [Candidatus Woesearchaeota archaeon]